MPWPLPPPRRANAMATRPTAVGLARALLEEGVMAGCAVTACGVTAAAAAAAVGGSPGLAGLGACCGVAYVAGAATGKRRRLGALEATVSALDEKVTAAERLRVLSGVAAEEWRSSNALAEPEGPKAGVAGEAGSAQLAERVASVEELVREHGAALLKLSEARDADLVSVRSELRSARDDMVAAEKRRDAELAGFAAGLVAQAQEIHGDGPCPPLDDAPSATHPLLEVPPIELSDAEGDAEDES